MRRLADGRKTNKRKPGPKPKSIRESTDRDPLICLHALKRFPKLKTMFREFDEASKVSRNLASVALALIEGDPIGTRPGAQICKEKLAAAADSLIKQHRAITRDRARAEDAAFLDKYSDALHRAALSKRAATEGRKVIATPEGLCGARAWPAKRALKVAESECVRGEPAWVSVARLGSTYLNEAEKDGNNISRRCFADLDAIGFPIEKVLQMLDLPQHVEMIRKTPK